MSLYILLAYIVTPFVIVVVVLAGIGVSVIWGSAREWRHECEEEKRISEITCKLWCENVQGRTNIWSSLSNFGSDEEVIGVLVNPQPPPFVRVSVVDDDKTSYSLHAEGKESGTLFAIDFGDSFQALAAQSITARLINTRTRRVMREFIWHRNPYHRRRSPDPQALAILRQRAKSKFDQQ